MLKLTSWEDGSPIYVRPEWIMSTHRLPAYDKGTARTRVDTRSEGCHLVQELPDTIYRAIIIHEANKTKEALDALQRLERCYQGIV